MRARLGRFAESRPGLAARLQLFGLLLLLVPLFAGLHYLIGAGVARVEVRVVSQDVPVIVPVERIVERIVERVVYVPVPADGSPQTAAPASSPTPSVAGTPTPASGVPGGATAGAAGAPAGGGTGSGPAGSGNLTAEGAVPDRGGPDDLGTGVPGSGSTLPPSDPGLLPDGPLAQVPPLVPEPLDAKPPELTVGVAEGVPLAAEQPGRPRSVGPPPVIIATEDRLGVMAAHGAGQPGTETVTVEVEIRRRRQSGGEDDRRSSQSSGGGGASSSGRSSGPASAPSTASQPMAAVPTATLPPTPDRMPTVTPVVPAPPQPSGPTPQPSGPTSTVVVPTHVSTAVAGGGGPVHGGPNGGGGPNGAELGAVADAASQPAATPTPVPAPPRHATPGAPRKTTIPAPIGIKPPPGE